MQINVLIDPEVFARFSFQSTFIWIKQILILSPLHSLPLKFLIIMHFAASEIVNLEIFYCNL